MRQLTFGLLTGKRGDLEGVSGHKLKHERALIWLREQGCAVSGALDYFVISIGLDMEALRP